MNDKIYLQHQYDALTKNATPLGLLDLAAQLKDFANTKLATVHIEISFRLMRWLGHETLTVKLEEGKRLNEALKILETYSLSPEQISKLTKKAFQQDPLAARGRDQICAGTWIKPGHVYTIYVEIEDEQLKQLKT